MITRVVRIIPTKKLCPKKKIIVWKPKRKEVEKEEYDSFEEELAKEIEEESDSESTESDTKRINNLDPYDRMRLLEWRIEDKIRTNLVTYRLRKYDDGVYMIKEIQLVMYIINKALEALLKDRYKWAKTQGDYIESVGDLIYIKKMSVMRYNQRQRHIPVIPHKTRNDVYGFVYGVIRTCRRILDRNDSTLKRGKFQIMKLSRAQEKYWEYLIRDKYEGNRIETQRRIRYRRPDIMDITRDVIYECKLGFSAFRYDQYEAYSNICKEVIYLFYDDTIMKGGVIYSKKDNHKMSLRPIKRYIPELKSVKVEEVESYL
jgi:hypothetical protein